MTTERQCAQCGRTFRAGSNLTCNPCRTTDRECVTCGRQFRGRDRECYQCKASDRPCKVCGQVFHGVKVTCGQCLSVERSCTSCGKSFRGAKNTCPSCQAAKRECAVCGRIFRGTGLTCPPCSATDRICTACGSAFHDYHTICRNCRLSERQCITCGRTFHGDQSECRACRAVSRPCITCGRVFRSPLYLECGTCSGRTNAGNARRRIRRLAAQINGPLPTRIYAAVLASGPCAYCGKAAESIDHIRPLARGGKEAEENLVPACMDCNRGKHARLLTEWDPARAAYGAAHSPKVAAELERELRCSPLPIAYT